MPNVQTLIWMDGAEFKVLSIQFQYLKLQRDSTSVNYQLIEPPSNVGVFTYIDTPRKSPLIVEHYSD